jgi:hypothetical protein
MKKKIKYVIITIILGAMGSGLWEGFISKILNYIFISISRFIIDKSIYYSNMLFKNISNGYDDQFTYYLATTIVLFTIMSSMFAVIMIDSNFTKENIKERSKIINNFFENKLIGKITKILLYIFILYSTFFHIFGFSMGIYINTLSTKLLNNIEIISPYIKDKDYKILKSEFYNINNQNDYYYFINKINKMNKKFNIKIDFEYK